MAKKPTAKSEPAAAPVASPAPAPKSVAPPKRLIATARPPAGRQTRTSPVAKDATPKAVPPAAPTATTNPASVVAPPKAAPKTAPAAPKPAKAKAADAVRKPAVKPIRLTSARAGKTKKPERIITHDEIAVRAYLIAERRQWEGRWAEPHEDWAEAERQLQAELLA